MSTDPEGERQGRRAAALMTMFSGILALFIPLAGIPLGVFLIVIGWRRWFKDEKR